MQQSDNELFKEKKKTNTNLININFYHSRDIKIYRVMFNLH